MKAIFSDRPGIFLTCLLAWTLTNMDQALFGFAVPGMLAEFGLSLQAVGVILTISFAAAALLVVLAGIAADRFGRGATAARLAAAALRRRSPADGGCCRQRADRSPVGLGMLL